jgi:hypothetical protein
MNYSYSFVSLFMCNGCIVIPQLLLLPGVVHSRGMVVLDTVKRVIGVLSKKK